MALRKVTPYRFYNTDNQLLSENKVLDIFLDKPFWIWDNEEHDIRFKETGCKCCHVDILGRPRKDGIDFPIFDYQKSIFDAIEQNILHLSSSKDEITFAYVLCWIMQPNLYLQNAEIVQALPKFGRKEEIELVTLIPCH
jgi:hypothetical protein